MMTPRNIYIYLRWVKTIKLCGSLPTNTRRYRTIPNVGFTNQFYPQAYQNLNMDTTHPPFVQVMLYEHHHCVPYLCQEILGVHPKDTYYLSYMYNYISKIHRYRHSYRYTYVFLCIFDVIVLYCSIILCCVIQVLYSCTLNCILLFYILFQLIH